MAIDAYRLDKLVGMIAAGTEHDFYYWPQWRRLREDVLKLDHYECQRCKQLKHRYSKAVLVHHVKHLRDRPDLALSIWDGKERQLVSVCKSCHEELHPESQRGFLPSKPPIAAERWD